MELLASRSIWGGALATVTLIVSAKLEKAVVPPLLAVVTLAPAVPDVWSQARSVSGEVVPE